MSLQVPFSGLDFKIFKILCENLGSANLCILEIARQNWKNKKYESRVEAQTVLGLSINHVVIILGIFTPPLRGHFY